MTATKQSVAAVLDTPLARQIVNDGIRRYIQSRRDRIDDFVDQTFSAKRAWTLNKHGFGGDIVRAPFNTLMIAPTLALEGSAALLRRFGRGGVAAKLSGRNLFLQTSVARELEWRLHSEFFELPYDDERCDRRFTGDALAKEILTDPRLITEIEPLVIASAQEAAKPGGRTWLDETITAYLGTRAAATELSTLILCLTTGASLTQQMTPGLISLGPAVARSLGTVLAESGTFGTISAGTLPPATVAAVGGTIGLVLTASIVSAISGVVTDPIQRKLGLHHRRLHQLLDLMEEAFIVGDRGPFIVADQYVGRVMDLADVSLALWHARPI